MKTLFAAALAAPLALASVAHAADAQRYDEPDDRGGVRIGTLSCDIDGGVAAPLFLMPEGLLDALPEQSVADLLAYLMTLKG